MKKLLFMTLAVSAFICCGEMPVFAPKAVSPRYAKVGKTPLHTLAQKGKAQCEIVLPAQSIPAVRTVARGLIGG